MSFDHLGLSPEILRAVREEGYVEPTAVQEQSIPYVLAGRDLMGRAQTGTGKTAAFVLPMLQMLKQHSNTSFSPARHPVRALIVTPTRELAVQIADSVKAYGRYVPLKSVVVYGGVPMEPQQKALLAGVEILVATPGRLLDHAGSRGVNLGSVEILVLDEADRMLDMGFIDDIRKIIAMLPAKRQNLMFSATFSPDIRALAKTFLTDPAQVDVSPTISAVESVEQVVYLVDADRKRELLAYLVRKRDLKQVLVFTRTKHMAARLASWLDRDGVDATAIHGDRTQGEREKALTSFKNGEVRVLVATDVAARGLDIEALPHVVNFELPMHAQDYVHRIGRTGRAGLEGHAITLVSFEEEDQLKQVNRLLKRDLPVRIIEGFEPDQNSRPERRAPEGRRTSSSGGAARSRAPRRTSSRTGAAATSG